MGDEDLHTFLIADLSRYSALTEQRGDQWAADVAVRFASEAGHLAAEHDVEFVKCAGDAVMLRGEDAREMLRLGLRLRRRLADEGDFPDIHAGLHTGVAVASSGDWWGGTVNVASRVASTATAGEVLITDTTKAGIGNMSDVRLRRRGQKRLKNISSPVRLFAADRRLLDPGRIYSRGAHRRLRWPRRDVDADPHRPGPDGIRARSPRGRTMDQRTARLVHKAGRAGPHVGRDGRDGLDGQDGR